MAARAVVRVRHHPTNGTTTVCIPKRMIRIWLQDADSVEVYQTDDGALHLLPTKAKKRHGPAKVLLHRAIDGRLPKRW